MVEDPAVGFTVIELPVPADVPPHEPVYQCHVAPVPRLPPVTIRVLLVPLQVLLFAIETPVGDVDKELTTTVPFAQPVVLQAPSALT